MLRPSSLRLWVLLCSLSICATGPEIHGATPAELKLQLGHSQGVNSVAFSPDGRFILTGGDDKTARLWEAASGREIARFEGHARGVTSVVFSPDGQRLLTTANDQTVRLWDRTTGREIRRFDGHSGGVAAAAFSPDGRSIVSGGEDRTARLWDVNTGRELRRFDGHAERVLSVCFSPDGRLILTGSSDNTARLWEVGTGREVRRFDGHTSIVPSVAFSPDDGSVVTGSWDGTVRQWETTTGREIRVFDHHREAVRAVAFSPDGRSISASGDTTTIWDVATGRETYVVQHAQARDAAFSPDSGSLAVVGNLSSARTFDRTSGRELRRFEGQTDWVVAAAFSPDGRTVLAASWDHTARLWDVATGQETRRLQGHSDSLRSATFSPNGQFALTSSWDNTTRLWETGTGREIRRFPTGGAVAFSPDGRSMLSEYGKAVRLWDVATGQEIRRFERSSAGSAVLAISPDARFVVDNDGDKTARLWDLATGNEIRRFEGHSESIRAIAFSPDGRSILTSGDHTARLWDVATGAETRRFEGHSDYVDSVAFAPDGRSVISGSFDKTARLWDVGTGRELHRFEGHSGIVASVAISRDGRLVITGSFDGSSRIWDVNTGRLLATMISFKGGGWAVVDPEGRYDASDPDDSPGLYWQVGVEVIELGQLKSRFYTPALLGRTLGLSPEPLPRVAGLSNLQLWPAVQLTQPQPGKSVATIRFTDRGGGIGRIVVKVNGREMPLATRGAAIKADTPLSIDLSAAELLADGENTIEVIAYDKANLVAGRGVAVSWKKTPDNAGAPPALHAILAGVSSYEGQSMSLRFPAKDALDMARAIQLGGNRMFGVGRTDIAVLATGTGREPTKENIRRAFESIPAKAGPNDVVLIYLAGHGVAGKAGSDQYYYLTRDARTVKPEDDALLWEQTTVSSAELLEWLSRKGMPLNQVIVLDTCAAGAATSELLKLADRRELTADQRRAIELLKDANNSSHILMGAAADKVSYEASRYGQGLLTYSLLLGIRGEALDEGGRLDVARWFLTAQIRVPEFARGIGGIQQPVIRSGGQTFPIALFTREDREQIPLPGLKPQLLRAAVHDDDDNDPLQLDGPVRAELRAASIPATRGDIRREPPLVYLDQVAGDVADAYVPQVRYRVSGEQIEIRLRLVSAHDRAERKFESSVRNTSDLAKRISEEFVQMLATLKPK